MLCCTPASQLAYFRALYGTHRLQSTGLCWHYLNIPLSPHIQNYQHTTWYIGTYTYIMWHSQGFSSNSTTNVTDMKQSDDVQAESHSSRNLDSYPGGFPFNYWRGHRLHRSFQVNLQLLQGTKFFVSNYSKFPIYQTLFQLMLCSLKY
jgi:hypothetical protein